jgi:hypothetical protein
VSTLKNMPRMRIRIHGCSALVLVKISSHAGLAARKSRLESPSLLFFNPTSAQILGRRATKLLSHTFVVVKKLVRGSASCTLHSTSLRTIGHRLEFARRPPGLQTSQAGRKYHATPRTR